MQVPHNKIIRQSLRVLDTWAFEVIYRVVEPPLALYQLTIFPEF
jgi:hypothetical protein